MIRLSVIIPTRNRADLLSKAIQSIVDQTLKQELFELIVVDNGSTDGTKGITESFRSKIINLVYIYDDRPGLHVGRHAGLKVARGDILVYADDDIRAIPCWMEGIVKSFANPQVALVGGNNFPEYEVEPPSWVSALWNQTPWGKANGYYSILDFGNEVTEISPYYVWGCNFSIRKSVLEELGGFHPDGMPENLLRYRGDGETAVSKGILDKGYKTIFNPQASVYHYVSASRMTLEYLYKRAYAQGISDSYSWVRAKGFSRKSRTIATLRCMRLWLAGMIKREAQYKQSIRLGYRNGYCYHQQKVGNDAELVKWVTKISYID